MATLQTIRTNRRTPATTQAAPRKKKAEPKQTQEPGLDALLASALSNPDLKAQLLKSLLEGKK